MKSLLINLKSVKTSLYESIFDVDDNINDDFDIFKEYLKKYGIKKHNVEPRIPLRLIYRKLKIELPKTMSGKFILDCLLYSKGTVSIGYKSDWGSVMYKKINDFDQLINEIGCGDKKVGNEIFNSIISIINK